MPRIRVLGGSFDPVHCAHLIVAERVREALALERLLFVPVWRQPLKEHEVLAPPADRLEMLRLALAGNSAFEVSPLELERRGTSYTADTLAELARRHPGAELFLILGADAYRLFHRWRRVEEIRRLARLVVVPRGPAAESGDPARPEGETEGEETLRVEVPTQEISASDIRARTARGASIRYLVPEPVRAYILERGLYR
jgi:nicotinate-nucleotide adenylyltransferase